MSEELTKNRVSAILDDRGRPFEATVRPSTNGHAKAFSFVQVLDQWYKSLALSRAPAQFKLQDPFSYHPWVFAAASAIATTAMHAPFTIFRETPQQLATRKRRSIETKGSWYGPRAGTDRTALRRHSEKRFTWKSVHRKALEPDFEHPLLKLFENPNPLQKGNQLWMMTILWMAVRGECMWIMTDLDGRPVQVGAQPEMVWPLSPDLFSPVLEKGAMGSLVAWDFKVPQWMPTAVASGLRMRVPLNAIVQFKLPNPVDLLRGFARLTPVISSIEADMMATAFIRSLLDNRAMPSGTVKFPGILNRKEEDEIVSKFEDRHGGPDRAGRLMVLQGGLEYEAVGFSPQDMEAQSIKKSGREEVLGVMATPPSALGLPDVANYATAQVFDKSFWDKAIIPLLLAIETSVDATLLAPETDDVFGMFDVSNVEAFRAGLKEKVSVAMDLAGDKLHMPPKDALALAGVEAPDYECDDVALVAAINTPVEQLVQDAQAGIVGGGAPPGTAPSGAGPAEGGGGSGGAPPPPEPAGKAITKSPECRQDGESKKECLSRKIPEILRDNPGMKQEQAVAIAESMCSKKCKACKSKASQARWAAFVKLETSLETGTKRAYRGWVSVMRSLTAQRLEDEARRVGAKGWSPIVKAGGVDVNAVVPSLKDSQSSLKSRSRPVYSAVVQETFDFTLDDLGGVAVFTVDDARIMAVLEDREKKLLATVPDTLRSNLYASLAEGIGAGETIQQLRVRIGEVYSMAASSSKTLAIARTETAGLMNGVRNAMFKAQGFQKMEWTTAGDENVRQDHVIFGEAGPQDVDFDYMTIAKNGEGGRLRMPGDPEGSASEVINCRCVQIPVAS